MLGYKFPDSVEYILKKLNGKVPSFTPEPPKNERQILILPEKNEDNFRAINYLKSRGIDEEIIKKCIENNLIYEEKHYHNVVFLGYDDMENIKYAGLRATDKNKFKADANRK